MKLSKHIFLICFITFITLALAGCDSRVSDPTTENSLIQTVQRPLIYSNNNGAQKDPATQSSQQTFPYYCLVSTLNPEAEDLAYRYRKYELNIPQKWIQKAEKNGVDKKWVTYRFSDKDATSRVEADSSGGRALVRMARCRLPATSKIITEIEQWLTKFGSESWVNAQKSKPSKNTNAPQQSGWQCTAVVDYYICDEPGVTDPANTEGCTYINSECVEYDYVEGNEGSGGDSDGGDEGGGSTDPGGNEGDPCEPDPDGGGGVPESCYEDPEEETVVIIIDPSFENNPCLSTVYNQAGQAPEYNGILKNFDGEFSVANLILSAGVNPNYPNANAVTFPPSNYNIEVMFNPNNLNRPSLSVARTLMHELIHAEMFRKLLSLAKQGNLDFTGWSTQQQVNYMHSIRNNFPGIYDYYRRHNNWQHQQMAQHYRGTIEQGLREFDGSFSNKIYTDLPWNGLQGTVAWENLGSDTSSVKQTIFNFRQNNPSCSN